VLKVFSKKRSFLVQKTRALCLLSETILSADAALFSLCVFFFSVATIMAGNQIARDMRRAGP
jgi:hypothetical protein